MTRIRRGFDRTLKSRAGQSTTEYILILAIVVMIASKLRKSLVDSTGKIMGNFDQQSEKFFTDGQ